MSDTPRTDAERGLPVTDRVIKGAMLFTDAIGGFVGYEFAQQLERELNAANKRIKKLESALEFGVGPVHMKKLLEDDHIGESNEMVQQTKEVPCPDCYGGHFKPCNICGDSGVAIVKTF